MAPRERDDAGHHAEAARRHFNGERGKQTP